MDERTSVKIFTASIFKHLNINLFLSNTDVVARIDRATTISTRILFLLTQQLFRHKIDKTNDLLHANLLVLKPN